MLARLNRLHEPSASSTAAYSNRTPSPNRQSLYDWAPAYDDDNQEENELDAILRELRRQQPDTHPDILRVLSQSQLDGDRRREQEDNVPFTANEMSDADQARQRVRERQRERQRRNRESEWVSLRSRAALQQARQDGAGSPSATERMLRYVMERERSGISEEEERARGTGYFRPSTGRAGIEDHRNTAYSRDNWTLAPPTHDLRERDRQERVEAFRRSYLAENAPPRLPRIPTPPVPAHASTEPSLSASFLESAWKYLSELRSCARSGEALSAAVEYGLATRDVYVEGKHNDFIMDLDELSSLPPSSWLQPGAVFEGHQHATPAGASLTHHQSRISGSHIEQINPNYHGSNPTTTGFDHPPGSTRVAPFDASRPWLSHQFTPPTHPPSSSHSKLQNPPCDQWPVRVTIHSINPEKMTLQGTMEAYDVPQHPASLSILHSTDRPKAGKKNAPIVTYLEGYIIDLRTHSFLTPGNPYGKDKSRGGSSTSTGPHMTSAANMTPYTTLSDSIFFPSANAHTDANNWRKLPPFMHLTSDDELARAVLSKSRMDAINQEYIFMRWKERCFVHGKDDKCAEADRGGDQDRGHGLTISGFYYVSLRRSDGWVEGLYFDPTSTPYQFLRLKGQGGGLPAFGFR